MSDGDLVFIIIVLLSLIIAGAAFEAMPRRDEQ